MEHCGYGSLKPAAYSLEKTLTAKTNINAFCYVKEVVRVNVPRFLSCLKSLVLNSDVHVAEASCVFFAVSEFHDRLMTSLLPHDSPKSLYVMSAQIYNV